jgi:hypothetical protein
MDACPECGRAGAPGVARRIVLPGDRRADEIALEVLACACGFKAIAVTEQPRRAALKHGPSDRVGYRLPAAAVDLLAFLIAQCPEPAEEYCECDSHDVLNRRDLRNQWNLLHSFAPFPGFPVAPASIRSETRFDYAPIAWTLDDGGLCAEIDGREWRAYSNGPDSSSYHLAIGDAIEIEIAIWPPFWRIDSRERV